MEPKWRDMCQIELSASINTGWDGDGRGNPKSSYTQPRLKATAPPVKRHLDCFPGEHVLLKIQKNKGLRLSGLPSSSSSSSSSSYVVMHVRRLALALNLSGTSQPPGVYCAFRAQLFMCPLPLTLHFFLSRTPTAQNLHAVWTESMGFEIFYNVDHFARGQIMPLPKFS